MEKLRIIQIIKEEIENINEIGEANIAPYPYKKTDEQETGNQIVFIYNFIAKNNFEYLVFLDLHQGEHEFLDQYYLDVGYGVKNENNFIGRYDFDISTNQGDVFKIMSTVIHIMYDVIKELNKDGIQVNYITFTPTKNDPGDDRRLKLDMAYLKRIKPTWEYSTFIDPHNGEDSIKIKVKWSSMGYLL